MLKNALLKGECMGCNIVIVTFLMAFAEWWHKSLCTYIGYLLYFIRLQWRNYGGLGAAAPKAAPLQV
jgi:hypothetical protein